MNRPNHRFSRKAPWRFGRLLAFPACLLLGVCLASPRALAQEGVAGTLGHMASSAVIPKDFAETATFKPTAVNGTRSFCFNACFCSNPNASPCTCDSSGTFTLDHSPSAPFNVSGYHLLTNSSKNDCDDGPAIEPPFVLRAGQRVAYTVSFSPTQVGNFSDFLRLRSAGLFGPGYYILGLAGLSAYPDIELYQPPGWSDSLVVSTAPGTQQDSTVYRSSDTLYVNWAVQNNSQVDTVVPFVNTLYLDGAFRTQWLVSLPVVAMGYHSVEDSFLGALPPGDHMLRLVVDETATGVSPHAILKELKVQGIVVPSAPAGWSGSLVVSPSQGSRTSSSVVSTGQPLYASFVVQNQGTDPTDSTFHNDLLLDGVLLQRFDVSPPLNNGDVFPFPDFRFGPLVAGFHSLTLVADSTQAIGASTSAMVAFTVVAPLPPPPAPPVPATSTSWYIRATRPYQQDSALYAWALQAGQKAGELTAGAPKSNFVVLDFGEPWKLANGSYGASGFGRPLTVLEIANVVKQFVLGYEKATPLGLVLAAGTSNNGPYVTPAHAQAWAKMLAGLDDWVKSERFNVQLAAANDAEPGFTASAAVTQQWFKAFHDAIASSGKNILIYDYGDAEACPTTTATSTPLACGTTGWTQKNIADLMALYIPEIYNNTAALEWEQISLYMDLRSSQTGTLIRGPLSQSKACTLAGTSCVGTNNTPGLAWRQLVRALNGSLTTAPGVPELLWSTDINWNTNKNQ